MHKHLALLRGINVSGHKIIKMEDLRKLMDASGFLNVKTFIQSGNIIFESAEKSGKTLSAKIRKMLLDNYGFDVSVVMLSKTDLAKAIKNNPFIGTDDDIKQLYVVFLSEIPSARQVDKIDLTQFEPDEFAILGRAIYIKFSDSASNSKLTNKFLETRLKVDATTRNWNTTLKLMAMMEE